MKLRKIHAAVLAPVAIVGIGLSSWAAVGTGSAHSASHPTNGQALQARQLKAGQLTAKSPAHRGTRKPGRPSASASADHRAGHRADHRAGHSADRRAGHSADRRAGHRAEPASVKHAVSRQPVNAAATAPQAAAPTESLQSGMSAFEQCVAWRESGDNPTASSAGLFGILPATWASLGYQGTAGTSSVAMQKAAFDRLYAADGTQPWAPYDGC